MLMNIIRFGAQNAVEDSVIAISKIFRKYKPNPNNIRLIEKKK